jgi:uncharacterized membrane protein YsdA (DUF1294 family)/cold shock CspA family protein
MRTKGKITSWNDEKGFGFITLSSGGNQVFIHIKAFRNRSQRPEINQLVSYSLSTDKHGRPYAKKAILAGDRISQKSKSKSNTGFLSITVAVLFLVIVGESVHLAKIPPLIFALYALVSLVTFIMYKVDKLAATNGTWRTQENTLHLLSLVGGWPGALVAQAKLRHKSKKQSFRSVFWITVLLNCSVFVWLHTPRGTALLQSLVKTGTDLFF